MVKESGLEEGSVGGANDEEDGDKEEGDSTGDGSVLLDGVKAGEVLVFFPSAKLSKGDGCKGMGSHCSALFA